MPSPADGAKYQEAPGLAEQVAAGTLPPIDERLPEKPLVLEPVHEIGRYGGNLRLFSPDLGNSIQEYMYGHSPIQWIDDGLEFAPGMCEGWSTNDDNSQWMLHFRKGLRWSDGEPCTVDDVLFWWNDMVRNPSHSDNPPDWAQVGGELVDIVRVDDYTLQLNFPMPAPLTAMRLANHVKAGVGARWIAPKHYLSQFHPTYNPAVTDFSTLDQKIIWIQNPECPTLGAWMCASYTPGEGRSWTRNPYYYAVDTAGNQLPYIDTIDEVVINDPEVQKLTVIQGAIDFALFHGFTLADVSVLKENEAAGGYRLVFWDSGSGTGMMYYWNNDHRDEKRRALFREPAFKRAMSHAIDRPTIQRVVYYNTGYPTTGTYSPKAIEFNFSDEAKALFAETRDAYVEYNPDKAMELLDSIGVQDLDGDGWREFPDGSKLEVRIDLSANAGRECISTLEIALEGWRAVGLNMVVNQMAPADFTQTWNSGQGELRTDWEIGNGPDHLTNATWLVPMEPSRWSPLSGDRLLVAGTEREDTELDKSPWDRSPARFASSERDLIGEPVWKLQEIYERAIVEPDAVKRHHLVWEMIRIHIDEGPFFLGTVANYPRLILVSSQLKNVPDHDELKTGGFVNPWSTPFPAMTYPETYFFA